MSFVGQTKTEIQSTDLGIAADGLKAGGLRQGSSSIPVPNSILSLVLGLLIPLLSLAPLLILAFRDLWQQIPYRFFPVAISFGILLLIISRGYQRAGIHRQRIGTAISLVGLCLGLWAMFSVVSNRAHFAAVFIVAGWALKSFGGLSWTRVMAICGLFAITLPIPRGYGVILMNQLHSASGWCASAFLECWAIPNVFENNVLRVAERQWFTWEECKDAGSLVALMGFALAWTLFRRRSMFVSVALLATCLLYSLMGDFFRLNIMTWLSHGFGIDASKDMAAIWIGIGIFLLNLICVVVSDISLAALFGPVVIDEGSRSVAKAYQKLVIWPDSLRVTVTHSSLQSREENAAAIMAHVDPKTKTLDWLLVLPCLLGLCGGALCLWVLFLNPQSRVSTLSMSDAEADLLPGKDALPKAFGTLRQINYMIEKRPKLSWLGEHSHAWQFDSGETQAIIYLDFPFSGWNDPSQTYSLLGWDLDGTQKQEMDGSSPWTVEQLRMRNRFGVTGNAWHAMFDQSGEPIRATEESKIVASSNLFTLLSPSSLATTNAQRHFQVRMFFETGRELTEEETNRYQQFFIEVYNRIRLQSATSMDIQGQQ